MDNFDLKKYLIENKVTRNSKTVLTEAKTMFSTGQEYLKAAAKDNFGIDLDDPDLSPDELELLDDLPAELLGWMQDSDPGVGTYYEPALEKYLEENGLELEDVAEYQFAEESYDFATYGGFGEFTSTIKVGRAVNEKGQPVKINGYDFIVQTDRGPIGAEYALMNLPHIKILKSVSDIYSVDAGWYAGYKGRTKN